MRIRCTSARGILDRVGRTRARRGTQAGRAALITDSNVAKLYAPRVAASLKAAGFDPVIIEIPAGEASKSLEMLATLYDRMTEAELDRQSVVFALGGGVTGDLGAFAAATYLRGIPVVQIPTTVVAQVDSALGGKSGVNHRLAKNLIGAFYQPRMIVADVESLKTLPEREFREGLGRGHQVRRDHGRADGRRPRARPRRHPATGACASSNGWWNDRSGIRPMSSRTTSTRAACARF